MHGAKGIENAAFFKVFNFSGHRVGIGQVEVPDARPLAARHAELLKTMRQFKDEPISA